MPRPSSDTSTIEGVAGALAAKQRGRDAAGDRHAAEHVAERGALVDRPLGRPGSLNAIAMPARAQKDAPSKPPLLGVGTVRPLAGAADVDDVRVAGPDVLDVDAEALAESGR